MSWLKEEIKWCPQANRQHSHALHSSSILVKENCLLSRVKKKLNQTAVIFKNKQNKNVHNEGSQSLKKKMTEKSFIRALPL